MVKKILCQHLKVTIPSWLDAALKLRLIGAVILCCGRRTPSCRVRNRRMNGHPR